MRSAIIATRDLEIREVLKSVLENKECDLDLVNKSSDLLLHVLEKDIDLLLLDFDIEGMSGLETLAVIKKSRPKVPVIVISMNSSVEAGRAVAQLGAFYHLLKPVNVKEVEEVIECALRPLSYKHV